MELKIKDLYRVQSTDYLSSSMLRALYLFYQPLVTVNGLALYMTLYNETILQKTSDSHQRLSTLLNLGIEDIERARVHLEEYGLLDSYVQEVDPKNKYVYELHAPLDENAFIASKEMMSEYLQVVGKKQFEANISRIKGNESSFISTNDYHKVTRVVYHSAKQNELDAIVEYSKIKPRYEFSDDEIQINFDYDHFFATTSTLVFPAELRTEENLRLIGKLATVYGLSADKMRVLVQRSINLRNMTLDQDNLRFLVQKSKPDIVSAKDPYSLPPVSFLQAKQNGAEVSLTDRKILEDLSMKMHFSNEVINVLIEYVLKKSQNKLIKTYVDMVAGEWARDNVTTKEDAIKETKKRSFTKSYGSRQAAMPEYMNQIKEKKETEVASGADLEEVKKMLSQMKGEEHGKD